VARFGADSACSGHAHGTLRGSAVYLDPVNAHRRFELPESRPRSRPWREPLLIVQRLRWKPGALARHGAAVTTWTPGDEIGEALRFSVDNGGGRQDDTGVMNGETQSFNAFTRCACRGVSERPFSRRAGTVTSRVAFTSE